MSDNETNSVAIKYDQGIEDISDPICEPIPDSKCHGHPYHCYCQQEKVRNFG